MNPYATSTEVYSNQLSSGDAFALGMVGLGIFFFILLTALIMYVVTSLLLSSIFKKAGQPRWAAWVPFYNTWKMLEIGGQQGFWAVLAIIPLVNVASAIFMFIAMYNIGLKLEKSGAFVLLAIFLPIVWLIWLAVDSSIWHEEKGTPQVNA